MKYFQKIVTILILGFSISIKAQVLDKKWESITNMEEGAWFALNEADILILDINMPKVDGIAVLQSFVKSGFQQKVIVLSSYDDTKLIKEVLKIGLSFFGPEDEISDVFESDIRLDYCVTPNKSYAF